MTAIEPFIMGWMAQWYGMEPEAVKVKLNECPGASVWEPKGPAESGVTVWVTESLFVQVTVAPVLTESVAGLNEKFWMLTTAEADVSEVFEAGAAGSAVVAGGGVCTGVRLELFLLRR